LFLPIYCKFKSFLKKDIYRTCKFKPSRVFLSPMVTITILFLIVISIVLMAVVLMQSSKGNGLSGPIGGSSVTMAFGVRRTSDILSKTTSALAVILMVGCIVVNLMIGGSGAVDESIIQKNAGQQQQQLPPNTIPPDQNAPPQGETPNQTPDQTPGQNQETDKNAERPPVNVEPEGP